jgi:uncharacterized protein Yka (UPF0111/DUF47 family)
VTLKQWTIPEDKAFFDLFDRLAAINVAASGRMVELIGNFTDVKDRVDQLELLEHEGDTITHQIYEHLNRSFITPLEPGEISQLASALDDIIDYIEGTGQKMYTYGIAGTDSYMADLAEVIRLSAVELEQAVKGIRTLSDPRLVEDRCIEVNRLENLADDILSGAIRDLFRSTDPIEIIKRKDIYEYLEMATDKCEDAANVLSDIAIRHS